MSDSSKGFESFDEVHLRALYTAMTEGVAWHELICDKSGNPIDYRIIEVNPAFEAITGLRRAGVIGRKASDIYGTGQPPYFEIYRKVALTGEPDRFETYFPPMDKHCSVRVFSPGPDSFATVFEDITERKQAEEALKKSEQLFRTITETAQDSIFCKDTKFRYTFVNPAMAELFGCRPEDLLGKTPVEIFGKEGAAMVAKVDAPVLKGETTKAIRTLQIGDQARTFYTIQVPLRDLDGKVNGMCGIVRDITDDLAHEAQLRHQQKLESIGTLAGGVAHEINNPVNIIMNYGELIQSRTEKGSQIEQFAEEIVSESHRIAKIVKNLLSFHQDHSLHLVLIGHRAKTDETLTSLVGPI